MNICGAYLVTTLAILMGAHAGSPADDGTHGFLESEAADVTGTLLWLSSGNGDDLGSRLEQLSAYRQILLSAWIIHHRSLIVSSEQPIPAPNATQLINPADLLNAVGETSLSAIFGVGRGDEFSSEDEYRQFLSRRSDRMTDVVLALLQQFSDGNDVSDTLIVSALWAVALRWHFLPPESKAIKLASLDRFLEAIDHQAIRLALLEAVFMFRDSARPILKEMAADQDTMVSRQADLYLVQLGEKAALKRYIESSWRVVRTGVGHRLSKPERFLWNVIDGAPMLATEQGQLEWLAGHRDDLTWDAVTGRYSLDENQ